MLRAGLKRLRDERSGNFSIMGALALVPLLLSVGFALDYTTMSRLRTELQNATDAAVLAVGREGQLLKQADAERIARQMLTATLSAPFDNLQVKREGAQVSVSARIQSGRMFGTFLRLKDEGITTVSTADLATLTYEIGLVLDTTGSMKGGKLAAMQEAVNELISGMSAQVKEEGRLRFALIPFSNFVNVGPQFGPKFDKDGKQISTSGASWLDLKGVTEMPQVELAAGASRFQLFENMKDQKWAGCVETRYAPNKDYDVSDEPASASKAGSLFVPAFAIDEMNGYNNDYIKFKPGEDPKPKDNKVKEKKARWNKYGVKTDNDGLPLLGGLLANLLGELLGGNTKPKKIQIEQKLIPGWSEQKTGPNFGCDARPITPLTDDFAGLQRQVNALTASGNTNITEGVSWGMRVLSPQEPFTEASAAGRTDVMRIMIVLTDGANTFGNSSETVYGSMYSSYGYLTDGRLGSGNASATNKLMNARTLEACRIAKESKVEIYTINLEVDDKVTGNMLQSCASGKNNYFNVQNRAKLGEAFKGIKDAMVKLKLAS